jgi:group II intron reverse transcriptase/maturase
MENQALARLEALRRHNADRGWVNFDLYRLLYRPELYEVAYERIKSKPGNMTAGSDGVTLDGFSFQVITDLIASLRDESFQFQPARRIHIPKANGKQRPLGIPSPLDKVVQEVRRLILEAIYDSPHGAYFRESSHGFRPNRSCHTALREFSNHWTGVTWIIEGDIQSCFDEIDHHVLVNLLGQKIQDGRFLSLIWKALRAGYLWGRERRDTLIGSPQGSILSPILANVYLHELDEFVEQLRVKYEKGRNRRRLPEYDCVLKQRRYWLKKTGGVFTPHIKELTQRMRSLPSGDPQDPDYVRVRYLRYADDWIVGVIGPRHLAETIKEEIRQFLKDRLKLELSQEKTRITHAKTEEATFLGTRLSVGKSQGAEAKIATQPSAGGRRFKRRVTGWLPILKAPTLKLVERLHQKGFCDAEGDPTSQTKWLLLDADQIIGLYNSILRGLLNYYRFVDNFASLSRIQYILRYSLAKTLAHKYRRSMCEIFRKHGRNLRFEWQLRSGERKFVAFAENTDWTVKTDAFVTHPPDLDLLGWHARLRTRSKLGFPCLICGASEQVEMHHVRHIRKMGERKPTGFQAVMRALNRKQIPVCKGCHEKIHKGEYDGIRLHDLAYDFAARPP